MWPNWQPIETAPRDGTFILTCSGNGAMRVVMWRDYVFTFGPLASADYKPTHWVKLPPPP